MKNLAELMIAGLVSLGAGMGCAASSDSGPTAGSGNTPGLAGQGNAGSGTAGTGVTGAGGTTATGTGGTNAAAGALGTTTGGSASGSAGAPGTAGSLGASGSGSGTAGGTGDPTSPAGTAAIAITTFSLSGCSQTVALADLDAKANGLTDPKPTQSYAAGTLTVDYTVTGQYAQVGIDFTGDATDLTGCTINATVQATAAPGCGVYAVPFFFDENLGTVAPYDSSGGKFVGEQISDLQTPATMSFTADGAMLTKVGRIGLNFYNCASSVTVGDL